MGGIIMTEENAIRMFKCLADKSRLQILKSLAVEDMYVELLAERLNLTPATISFHLRKLSEIDAVGICQSSPIRPSIIPCIPCARTPLP